MINSKNDYKDFILADCISMYGKSTCTLKPLTGLTWRYIKNLRKLELYINTKGGILHRLYRKWLNLCHYRLGIKLGFDIPINVCGKGMCIHHYGNIIINANSVIGEQVVIQQGVVIGFNGRNNGAPIIGKNVYIGCGAKILGNIYIADNCIIGANAVVVKDFNIPGSIIAGVPAKVIGQINVL